MTLQSYLSEETSSHFKLLQCERKSVRMQILHVGGIPPFMNSYLIRNQIANHVLDSSVQDTEIDMILVYGEGAAQRLSGTLKHIRPIVTYTKSYRETMPSNTIPFILVPILIKYLLKIKESMTLMNRRENLDNADRFLHRVTATIDEHLDDHTLTMKKLSSLIFMSRSCLSKKIKKLTGLKPTEFINSYKLEKSKHLLLVTNWQIGKIADELGFCSQQYYCRLFKKAEGINPSRFRKDRRRSRQKYPML